MRDAQRDGLNGKGAYPTHHHKQRLMHETCRGVLCRAQPPRTRSKFGSGSEIVLGSNSTSTKKGDFPTSLSIFHQRVTEANDDAMDSRRSTSNLPVQGPSAIYEVPEFMVRRLDGHIHPALTATPGSGFICTGSGQWEAERTETTPLYATASRTLLAILC